MKSKRSLVRLALPFVLCAAAAAPIAAGGGGGSPSAATEASTALEMALDAVRADSIRADIRFIASDELEGRYTPSPGLRVAARYIRARLERLGFEPGAKDGFFHTYPLQSTSLDEAATKLRVETAGGELDLKLGQDYFYRWSSFSEDSTQSGPLVFCGTGSDEELAQVNLEGAWALVLDGGKSSRRSSSTLRESKALGSIYVPAASYEGESYSERFLPSLERARQGSVRYSSGGDSGGRMRGHTQIYVERAAGLRLLAAAPNRAAGAGEDWLPPLGTRIATLTDERRIAGAADGPMLVENVCGFWRGRDPELWKDVVIVSAHYDHMGIQGSEIQNGADDNGSGTTGLLAVAEALKAYGPLRRSVLLIWVSGEERGLWGSHAWTREHWLPEGARPVANLNIDMIGRNAPRELFITPTKDHEEYNGIVRIAQSLASLEGFDELGSADDFYHRSDQANFATLDIPVAFLFSGIHEDYHQPTDDPEKIDYDKVRRVSRLVVRLIDALQTDKLEL